MPPLNIIKIRREANNHTFPSEYSGKYLNPFKTEFRLMNVGCPGFEGVVGIGPIRARCFMFLTRMAGY